MRRCGGCSSRRARAPTSCRRSSRSSCRHSRSAYGVNAEVPAAEARRPLATLNAVETKWLEDFVSLAETRSFSRSAQLRHVTQPAFSRRIQSLEAWAGIDLVDRSSYPTRLTPAGETLYAQSLEVLQALQSTRAMLRGHSAAAHDVLDIAVPHTLAFTFFPHWISTLREQFG